MAIELYYWDTSIVTRTMINGSLPDLPESVADRLELVRELDQQIRHAQQLQAAAIHSLRHGYHRFVLEADGRYMIHRDVIDGMPGIAITPLRADGVLE